MEFVLLFLIQDSELDLKQWPVLVTDRDTPNFSDQEIESIFLLHALEPE